MGGLATRSAGSSETLASAGYSATTATSGLLLHEIFEPHTDSLESATDVDGRLWTLAPQSPKPWRPSEYRTVAVVDYAAVEVPTTRA
jgi:hypothetical protein